MTKAAVTEGLKTPLEMLYHWEKNSPNAVYLRQPMAGEWQEYSWKRAAEEARRMASRIRSWHLPPGSHIAIASKNCAHWVMADMAIWMAGHVSVPLYPNLSAETVRLIMEHSEAKALFLGKLDNFKPYIDGKPADAKVIAFPYGAPKEFPLWDEVLLREAPITDSPARRNDELATIIYTSGTTGVPKGVMHNFLSFSFAGTNILKDFNITQSDRLFSYLPLAHVAERLLTETVGIYSGATLSFVESIDLFGKNLEQVQPTVFLGVPRIWEKFQAGIVKKLPPAKMDKLLGIPVLSWVIRRKIQKALGLRSARYCVSGAAPLAPALNEWFRKIGIKIQEGYGLTENFAYSHINRSEDIRIGTVGRPWRGVETKIADGSQEILVKNACLMRGYYKAPELTAEVVTDGYLHTGDQGAVDGDFLKITGRVKELFKTAKGKYVAPSPIELKFAGTPGIEHVCVTGTGLPQPLALVTKSEIGKAMDEAALVAELKAKLEAINATLDPHERMSRILVVKETWTVENEYLTPSMKLKRNVVEKHYDAMVTKHGQGGDAVIFL